MWGGDVEDGPDQRVASGMHRRAALLVQQPRNPTMGRHRMDHPLWNRKRTAFCTFGNCLCELEKCEPLRYVARVVFVK